MSFSSDLHPGSSYVPPTNAAPTHGDDSTSLRADLDALKEQLAAFVARAGSDAMKTAREATADVASQVGSKASEVASQVGNKASELATTASEQAKTFASEARARRPQQPARRTRGRAGGRCGHRADRAAPLMFRALLQLSGIERRLQDYRERIEGRAERLIQQGKAVAMQLAVAAALATGAIVSLILAFIAGLLVLYLWLRAATSAASPPPASWAARWTVSWPPRSRSPRSTVGRRQPQLRRSRCGKRHPMQQRPTAAAADAVAAAAARTAAAEAAFAAPPRPLTPTEVDAILGADDATLLTRLPEVGVEPLDALLKGLTPRAEEAGKGLSRAAAALVRDGDRTTMLTILGAAACSGVGS